MILHAVDFRENIPILALCDFAVLLNEQAVKSKNNFGQKVRAPDNYHY